MRTTPKAFITALACCFTLAAQEATPERITVPFSNPNGAKTVNVSLLQGNITVKAYSGKEVIVEARGNGPGWNLLAGRKEPPPGMRRVGPANAGLGVEESANEIRVRLGMFSSGEVTLQVPADAALKLHSMTMGNITVEGTSGEIDAESLNGNVTLTNVSGAIVAHSLNGKVLVTMNQVPAKPMSFSTLNGEVDVTLPANTKADLKMKSGRGDIFSDFDIPLKNQQPASEVTNNKGKYKVKFDSTVTGTLNGGGPELQFTTFNGTIYIRKK